MLMPQLAGVSGPPAGGESASPFDDDPVVRAARQVRDAAVAERRRSDGTEGEEEEKGQREAKLQEDRKMQEAKERARKEREKNDEEVGWFVGCFIGWLALLFVCFALTLGITTNV